MSREYPKVTGKACPRNCNGGSIKQNCGTCVGKGCNDCNKNGWVWVTCPRCHGSGRVDD